jgi:pimeloyl-ACP methyl ester carboxylesterase
MPPRHHAIAAQQALDQLMADCNADAKCGARYPRLRTDLANALLRIGRGRQIGAQVVMERLRTKLYSPSEARTVPWVIHRLSQGDTSILVSRDDDAGFKFYDGVYLTITCSESLPWFSQERAAAKARHTLFGDYRLARQREACAHWPRAQVKRRFFAPVRSSVPTLFLSGGRDPVTPASWATQASRYLPNSRQIVIPWGGHIVDGLTGLDTCFDPQILRFYETADPSAADASCFKRMTPPPFKVAP